MNIVELASPAAGKPNSARSNDGELISALAGRQANRDSAVAHRTRRVVLTSLGVMQQQKAGGKRSRSVALAGVLVALFLLGPALWRVADDLIGGERFGDIATQFSLFFCVLCVAIVAAVLIACWAHRSS
ncbi:MAG: hypothetical protein ACRD27_04635 [Terracidiphilus sp.]